MRPHRCMWSGAQHPNRIAPSVILSRPTLHGLHDSLDVRVPRVVHEHAVCGDKGLEHLGEHERISMYRQ